MPTTFTTQQHRPFRPPVTLRSANGLLRTSFTAEPTTFSVAGAKVKGFAYRGQYIGPTLRVRPGDTVRIDRQNKLGQPTRPLTVRVVGASDPILNVRTNQTQMLRLANIGADIWYRLKLSGAQFRVIAQDANPISHVWTADELVLPPGKRYDVLVRLAPAGHSDPGDAAVQHRAGRRQLPRAPADDLPPQRRRRPGHRLAAIARPGVPAQHCARRSDPSPGVQREHEDQPVLHQRQAVRRDPHQLRREARRHREWTITNVSGEQHPFHIHVNDFEVMSVNGKAQHLYGEQDTVPLPAHGEVKIRMHFARYVGPTVFHCHILAHEDNGMLGIIDLTRDGRPSKATLRALKVMNREMHAQHSMSMSAH